MKILGKTGHGDYCTDGFYTSQLGPPSAHVIGLVGRTALLSGGDPPKGGIHTRGTSTSLFLKTARTTP
jgi:hypothetical protein